jgi:hypothetical protein
MYIIISIILWLIYVIIRIAPIIGIVIVPVAVPAGRTPGVKCPIIKSETRVAKWIVAISPGVEVSESVPSVPPVPSPVIIIRVKAETYPGSGKSKSGSIIIWVEIPGI